MLADATLDLLGFQELMKLSAGRSVLYVYPGGGGTVTSVLTESSQLWTVGPALERDNPHDPTPAAELVHVLEATTSPLAAGALLGDAEVLLGALVGVHFDLVVIDWCDARLFTHGLMLRALAIAPRIAIVGPATYPRATILQSMMHGTGYLYYEAGTLGVFTSSTARELPEAEVY